MFDDAYNVDRERQLDDMVKAGQLEQAMTLLETWYEREPWNSEVLIRMAVVHWLAGQPAQTLRDLDDFLALEPDNAEALARRAQALLMLGKRNDAEASLARAEALDPLSPGVLLNRALIEEADGDYGQAIISLSAYLEQMPQDHLALARRSHLHRQLGNYSQALEDAQACIGMQPDDPESHFAEALALVTLEQGENALAACDHCLRLQASFLPALRLKVDLLSDLGRIDAAEVALSALDAYDPDAPHTRVLHARIAAERDDYATALTWINRYLDDHPDEPYGYYRRGMIYYRMGRTETALTDFQEYARLAPRALEAFEQQFLCYLDLARYPEAVRVGTQAVEVQPENYRLHFNLAFAQLLCGEVAQAKAGFLRSLTLHAENEELLLRIHLALTEHTGPEVRLSWFQDAIRAGIRTVMVKGLLAEAYLETSHAEEALQLSREILAEDFRRPFGYLLGIKALCLLDRYLEALAVADAGVEALPEEGRLRLARALVLRDLGKPDEALAELQVAEMLLPGEPEVLRQRALVYGSISKTGEAIQLLKEALKLDTEHADTYFWLGYFSLHRRRYRQALEAANRLLMLASSSAEGHFLRGAALRGLHRHQDAEREFLQARALDAALLPRLARDPVIAELLASPRATSLLYRIRRTLAAGWASLCHTLGWSG